MNISPKERFLDICHFKRLGDRGISARFIIGAIKAFPGYKLGDLFYVSED